MKQLFCFIFLFAHSFSNLVLANHIDDYLKESNIDRLALIDFKSKITDDPRAVLNNWNDSISICRWHGVTCGGAKVHRRVVALTFYATHLVGTLSPFVGNLSYLHHLNLSGNYFEGQIPPQIGRLLRLRSLSLSNNSFTGDVPANISRCLKLQILALREYGQGSMVSKAGDTYSYGIVLLEMMTTMKPTDGMFEGNLYLHQHAKSALPDQLRSIIDPRLLGGDASAYHGYQDEYLTRNARKILYIKSMIEIGVKCSVESPQDQMNMDDVVRDLQILRDKLLRSR